MNRRAWPGVMGGSRPASPCAAFPCRSACFWAAWPWLLRSLATSSFAGTGGCCETAQQPHRSSHVSGAVCFGLWLLDRDLAVASHASHTHRGIFHGRQCSRARAVSHAHLQRRDPATETTET